MDARTQGLLIVTVHLTGRPDVRAPPEAAVFQSRAQAAERHAPCDRPPLAATLSCRAASSRPVLLTPAFPCPFPTTVILTHAHFLLRPHQSESDSSSLKTPARPCQWDKMFRADAPTQHNCHTLWHDFFLLSRLLMEAWPEEKALSDASGE